MILDFEFDGEPLERLTAQPFVQTESLVAVTADIADKDLIEKNLKLWLKAARMVQAYAKCSALAFNQLNLDLLKALGFNSNLPPSLIYVPDVYDGSRVLLINPKIVIPANVSVYPEIEGCGSIRHGKIVYIINRPEQFDLTAQIYDGYSLSSLNAADNSRANRRFEGLIHEDAHLRLGQTGLSRPQLLLDITQAEAWQRLLHTYSFWEEANLRASLEKIGQQGLAVPTPDGYKIVELSEIGKY